MIQRLLCLTFAVLLCAPAWSADDEPTYDELIEQLKRPWFKVGLLIQIVGDYQGERPAGTSDGFSLGNARLSLGGDLDGGFSYFFQGTFAENAALLDGFVGIELSERTRLRFGLKKTPFSAEFLESAAGIDFVNRSRVVSALAPNRQLGAEFSGYTSNDRVHYSLGLFNGNRFAQSGTNDNDRLLSVGRIAWHGFDGEERRLVVAGSAGYSSDTMAVIPVGTLAGGFDGTRKLYGIDARYVDGPLLLAAEAIRADLDFTAGGSARPEGWYATVGYHVAERHQLLVRWDAFDPDTLGVDSDQLLLGYNFWPTQPTELQINLVFPTDGGSSDRTQLLVNAQVAF